MPVISTEDEITSFVIRHSNHGIFNIRAYIGGVTLDKQYPMMHFTGIQYVAAGLEAESGLFGNNDL